MTAVELQEDRPEVRGDLKDRIHGVRLEVCKSRTEMGKIETRLVEKMGEMETRLVENTGKMETRLVEKMGRWRPGRAKRWNTRLVIWRRG